MHRRIYRPKINNPFLRGPAVCVGEGTLAVGPVIPKLADILVAVGPGENASPVKFAVAEFPDVLVAACKSVGA